MDVMRYASHLGVFLLGIATGLLLVRLEGRSIHSSKEPVVKHKVRNLHLPAWFSPDTFKRVPVFVTVLLVVSALLVGFGIQQAFYQHAADERDNCYSTWGEEVIETITVRTDATSSLAQAQDRRDKAVDNIILVFVGAADAGSPPRDDSQVARDFQIVLTRFASAKTELDAARKRTATTRRQNPYPVLDC